MNYDPAWETTSYVSDWEYYSDEYWEQESSRKRKHKADSGWAAGVKHGSEHANKKQRKRGSREMPELSIGESSLAAGGVVWKSKKEALESHDGPVVTEGQLEKVSLFEDWREHFKTSTSFKPKFIRSRSNQDAELVLDNETSSGQYGGNILPPPPMTLEEAKALPSRSRNTAEPSQEFPREVRGASSFPSHDEDFDTDDDSFREAIGTGINGNKKNSEPDLSIDDSGISKSPQKRPGRPRKLKSANANEAQGDGDLQTPIPVPVPPGKERPSGHRKQKSCNTVKEHHSGSSKKEPVQNTVLRGKRKVDKQVSDVGEQEEPIQKRKRGRPKQQNLTKGTEDWLETGPEAPTYAATPAERKKPGRPRKQKPSPLNQEVVENTPKDTQERTDNSTKLDPVRNVSALSTSQNGITLTGSKRKAESSDDELSKPLPKRQNSSRATGKAVPKNSMNVNEPTNRRSKRSKRT